MSLTRVQALREFAVGLGKIGLGDFSPGVDAARAQGIKVTRDPYALGDAGTLGQSIPMVLQKIREGRLDPAVRGWTGDVLHAAGDPQGIRAKCDAILNAFRAATIYAPDPAGAEYIQSAAATLCLRPGLCVRARDCDDGSVCVGSCLSSINIPVWVVFQDFGPGKQQHVLLVSQDELGNKFYIDPSTKWPVGNAASAVREEWFDPLDGLAAPEIVGVGWSPVEAGIGSNPSNSERHLVKRADGAWWEYARGGWYRESEVGIGWAPAEWESMKPIVHEVGMGPNCPGGCGKKVAETPRLGEVSLEGVTATLGPRQRNSTVLNATMLNAITLPHRGVDPLVPPNTEYIDTDFSAIKAGARYLFAIRSDLDPSTLVSTLSQDWNVETWTSDLPTYFRVRAIALHDMPPGPASGDVTGGSLQYLTILVEVASGTTVPLVPATSTSSDPTLTVPTPTNPPADVSSVNGPSMLLGAAITGALVGVGWGIHRLQSRKKR